MAEKEDTSKTVDVSESASEKVEPAESVKPDKKTNGEVTAVQPNSTVFTVHFRASNSPETDTPERAADTPESAADTKPDNPRPYVNLEVRENQPPEPDINPRPYVNINTDSPTLPKQALFTASDNKSSSHVSEHVLQRSHFSESDARARQRLTDSRLKLLPSSQNESTCKKCKELESVVALWELGASGLTRNYSKILSLLNKAREAARMLEGQTIERGDSETKDVFGARNMSVSSRKTVNVRQSMYETAAGPLSPVRITDQMYPSDKDSSAGPVVGRLKQFKELTTHLTEAIDLCQQLAAANFKSNQKSVSKRRLKKQPTLPSKLNEDSYRPALQSIAESSLSGSFKKQALERTPSAPDSILRRQEKVDESPEKTLEPVNEGDSKSEVITSQSDQDEGLSVSSDGMQSSTSSSTNQKQYISHMMKLCSEEELESECSTEESVGEGRTGSVLSAASTFSDSDVKQIMSKIADLEEDRFKLLATIDELQRDNNTVRLSLSDILGDLQNKDLQLTLAMQDLSLATGEIKRAAEMRGKLQEMETERNALYERLSNLEDESAAVKVSLIQLLQEKSATNKTLALENWRLNQRMKSAATMSARRNGDGDNVSVSSGFSSLTDDAVLQEAYMGADDVASFVHKQGFLVKQGGRRKNWKRRLFVLSPEGLSYYKTEQPLQVITIDKIMKVQICHGRTAYPHMFEVHTPGRVFLLSAPSEDEMQSWVGMLQTLKQYNKGTSLNREATARRQEGAVGGASPVPPIKHTNGDVDSPDSSPDVREKLGTLKGAGPLSPKRGAGPEMSSEDDDDIVESPLVVHSNHFGSDDDLINIAGATPMSVPTMNPLDNLAGAGLVPNVKPRLRSDST